MAVGMTMLVVEDQAFIYHERNTAGMLTCSCVRVGRNRNSCMTKSGNGNERVPIEFLHP